MSGESQTKSERYSYDYLYAIVGYSVDSYGNVTGSKTPTASRGSQFVRTNSFIGETNPKWKDQIRAHVNATTPASGIRYSHKVSPFTGTMSFDIWDPAFPHDKTRHFYSAYGYILYDVGSGVVGVPGNVKTNVRNRAIASFIDKCKAARSSIEGGQDLYEYKQTLNTLRHPLKSLRDLTTHYTATVFKLKTSRRYKGPVGRKGLEKAIVDTYLEYTFGVNPLVADVSSIIADASRTRFKSVSVSASASEEFGFTEGTLQTPGVPFMLYELNQTRKSKYVVRYKGAVSTGVKEDGTISMAQSLRLVPEEFLPTVWDCLPFSWMLDYVANVGDIITALSFPTGSVVWGCVTNRTENTVTYAGNGRPQTIGLLSNATHGLQIQDQRASGGDATFKTVSFLRDTMYGSDFYPDFQVKIPHSVKPFINSLAVGIQQSRRLLSR